MENLSSIEEYAYLLFGKIACERRILEESQLKKALQFQQQNPEKKLGEICLFLGYLSSEDLRSLLQEQEQALRQNLTKWYTVPDLVLENLVLSGRTSTGKLNIMTLLQAKEMKKKLPSSSLLDILYSSLKLIDATQVKKIRNSITLSFAHCSACQRKYGLFNYSGEKIFCPVCPQIQISSTENKEPEIRSIIPISTKKTVPFTVVPKDKTARLPTLNLARNKTSSEIKNLGPLKQSITARLPTITGRGSTRMLTNLQRSGKKNQDLFPKKEPIKPKGGRRLFLEKMDPEQDLEKKEDS